MDEKTEGQLRVIRKVIAAMQAADISAWLFGGWGLGRWSDWLFPPGSFGDEHVRPDGTQVPAMSASGMLAMKEQFPHLCNGRPWRQKDIADIEILRRLARLELGDEQPTGTLDQITLPLAAKLVPRRIAAIPNSPRSGSRIPRMPVGDSARRQVPAAPPERPTWRPSRELPATTPASGGDG